MRSTIDKNLILEQLRPPQRQKLAASLRPQWLNRDEELTLGGDVVFPLGAVISLIHDAPDGLSVEAAFVGFEGLLAIGPTDNVKACVQVAGEALRMSRSDFQELQDDRAFRDVTDRYRDQLLGLSFRTCTCLVSHPTERRLATILLAMAARAGRTDLELTQEYLAAMLGVRRPTVTIAAGFLQSKGVVQHRYGRVTILDATGLESLACPCFAESGNLLMP